MSDSQQPHAVAVALAHCEAWSNHDYDTARRGLASDVKVRVTTTMEGAPKTETDGIDEYMEGLIAYAKTVVPGSLQVNASVGDERNALVMVTVQTDGPPFGSMTLPAARLYLFDENDKITNEQVIFYAVLS